jgi:hypothetical protein
VIWRAPALNTSRASSSVASITRTAQTVGRLMAELAGNRGVSTVRAHTVPTICPQSHISPVI